MKTLAIFVLALFVVVMAQDRVKVVDNNPILPDADSFYNQPSVGLPPNGNPQGYQRPSYGPAYVNPTGGDYRKEWAANHKVPPGARGGK